MALFLHYDNKNKFFTLFWFVETCLTTTEILLLLLFIAVNFK